MGYRCWAERFVTADFSGSPVHKQGLVLSSDTALKAIRTRFVLFNAPVFTELSLRIYSSAASGLGTLLMTSTTTWTKAQISSYDHSASEIYFEFSGKHLSAGSYFIVPWITGYTGTESTHVAWVRAYPDPTYTTGLTLERRKLSSLPYSFGIVGSTL